MRVSRLLGRAASILALLAQPGLVPQLAAQRNGQRTLTGADILITEFVGEYRRRHPELVASGTSLFDNSLTAERQWRVLQGSLLVRIRKMQPRSSATSSREVALLSMKEWLEASRQFAVCKRELWNVSPITGWFAEHRRMAAEQQVRSPEAERAAIARWASYGHSADTEIANLRRGLSLGYVAPRILVEQTIRQIDETLRAPNDSFPLAAPGRRGSPEFRAEFARLVRDQLVPAVRRYRDFLSDAYLSRSRERVGVYANPQGRACFDALIRRYTTTGLSAESLETLGRQLRTAALRQRAATYGPEGLTRSRRSLAEPGYGTANEVLDAARIALARAASAAPTWFSAMPKAPLPRVEPLPGGEASDPTAQYVAGCDNSDTARIYVNTASLQGPGGKAYLERVMFHEGIPGHHLQLTTARERSSGDPLENLLYFPAYSEGWAVYASGVAAEMDLYSSTESRIPVVEALIDDALTLIVQAGLHVRGWTRAQAVDSLLAYSAVSRAEAEQQVDYYIAAPGHALAYPVGARALLDARHRAERVLGSRFDMRAFHDVVLARGAMPLSVVAARIASWTHSQLEGTQSRKRQ